MRFANQWHMLLRVLLLITSCAFVSACVTETTGGFNVEKSDKQALLDYIQLASGYLQQGDMVNTKRHLANASKLDRNNPDVYAIWGLVYAREGEVELADENFRRSLRIQEDNAQVRNNYAAFLSANSRWADAYKQLELVVQDTEYLRRPMAFENMGKAALALDRPADAEFAFGRALRLEPNMMYSTLELTVLELRKGDLNAAQERYRNFQTLLLFNNQKQSAYSLWVGIQLEHALGNAAAVKAYGDQLKTSFSASAEYQQYLSLLEN